MIDYEKAFKDLSACFYLESSGRRVEYMFVEGTDVREFLTEDTANLLVQHLSDPK